jgi:hypothetical protein
MNYREVHLNMHPPINHIPLRDLILMDNLSLLMDILNLLMDNHLLHMVHPKGDINHNPLDLRIHPVMLLLHMDNNIHLIKDIIISNNEMARRSVK